LLSDCTLTVASHAVFRKKASPVEKINSSWNRRHSISSDHMGAQVKGERQASAALSRRRPPATRQTIHLHTKKGSYMIKPSKAMIAGAAVAGLLTGSLAVRAYAASTSGHAGVSLQTMADAEKGKHGCKGQNECKGQGGCKAGDNGCKGKNACKGKGGCGTEGGAPAASPTPSSPAPSSPTPS